MTTIAVIGVGAVGARVARQLLSTDGSIDVVLRDERAARLDTVARSLGEGARIDSAPYNQPLDVDVVVLAGPPGTHLEPARRFVGAGIPVVSVSDEIVEVRALLDLDVEARERGVGVAVGAGFAPGLSCVLAAYAATRFDEIDEIHVAKVGTGGPACARQHHRALRGHAARLARPRAGPNARPGAAVSSAGSRTRSGRRTATGRRWSTACCSCRRSPASPG